MTPTPADASHVEAIHIRGLTKSFGDVRAVDGLDLRIERGEIVAFLGPNGAGKTTTLDIVLGLGNPDQGTVEVLGMTPREAIVAGRVSAVMQTGGLLKDVTVRETVMLTASFYRTTRPVDECLERAGLTGLGNRRVGACSGGEQQRLRFAMALTCDPDLLILDEPTTGMDVGARRAFWDAVRADALRGRTIVFATHYLEEAEAFADRVILISHGKLVADGTAAQVTALSGGRTVSAYLPDPTGETASGLRDFPGVRDVTVRGDRILLNCTDSDRLARHLLTATAASDLEITSRGLEDVFIDLTSEPAARLGENLETVR
jgi:ABC-2 type transport system ATP-binding protein